MQGPGDYSRACFFEGVKMNPFGVSDAKVESLRARMGRLGIREEDLAERFVRSGGPGGQNVNKVATCVLLRHLPTGLEVKVQQERSQGLNRFLARRLLVEKLEAVRLGKLSAERQRIYRIRRQKRKRSKRAQEKVLAGKRLHALKKRLRSRPTSDE